MKDFLRRFIKYVPVTIAVMLVSCDGSTSEDQIEDSLIPTLQRPEGWTEETHGRDATPNYDVVFAQDRVNRLDVTIDPENWQTMLDDITEIFGEIGTGDRLPIGPGGMKGVRGDGEQAFSDSDLSDSVDLELLDQDPIWVPCTLVFEDTTWWHVGIRFKGYSSLKYTWAASSYKLPLKFDFDQFEDEHPELLDQRFYGFKRLALTNNGLDPSYLREKIAGDLFRDGGVPSSRKAFYRVFIDMGEGSVYFGLYTMVEVPDRPMFLTQFGDAGGNLYKPEFGAANWNQGLPINENSFSKKTNSGEADWSDVEDAIAALHDSREDPEVWRAGLDEVFDADGFLRWLAINTVIQDWDTYGNLPHNYYLYGDPTEDGRLHWIPWDNNMALFARGGLKQPLPLDMSTIDDEWPLIRYLIDDPVYEEAYWAYVKEFTEGAFSKDPMKARIQAEYDLIAPYITGPEGEQTEYTTMVSKQSFENSPASLSNHVEERHQVVAEALETR